MRRLRKSPLPVVLEQNSGRWLQEFLAEPDSDTKRYRYRDPSIKEALKQETGDKCVYCESKIGHNTPGDVEHKIPTSKVRHKHFDWSNLTIACTECNRRKDDYYSRAEGFLDPYEDDVENCLVHLGPIVYWRPGHSRAEKTVRTLELDSGARQTLIERKLETLEKARSIIENLKSTTDPLLNELRRDELLRMSDESAAYSAMVTAYLERVHQL